jgi:hypothetical protein
MKQLEVRLCPGAGGGGQRRGGGRRREGTQRLRPAAEAAAEAGGSSGPDPAASYVGSRAASPPRPALLPLPQNENSALRNEIERLRAALAGAQAAPAAKGMQMAAVLMS